MKNPKYQFRKFTHETLELTRAEWSSAASDAGVFPSEIEQIFDWTAGHVELVKNEIAYGVFEPNESAAVAIVEVVIMQKTSRSKLIKLLRVRLHPRVEAGIYNAQVDDHHRSLWAFVAAFAGVLSLKGTDPSATLKVYGRSNDQLTFLRSAVPELQKVGKNFVFRMDGRFLVAETV